MGKAIISHTWRLSWWQKPKEAQANSDRKSQKTKAGIYYENVEELGRSSRWGCPWANYLPFLQNLPQDPISYVLKTYSETSFKTITADFPSPHPAAVTLMYEYQSRYHGCRQHASVVFQPCKSEVNCHSVLENFTRSTGSLDEERQGEREYLPLGRHVDRSPVTSRLWNCNVIHFRGCLFLNVCLLRTPMGSEHTCCRG